MGELAMTTPMQKQKAIKWTVIVAALGYFVDIFDLLLFSIVRVSSLRGIGVTEDQLLEKGVLLINCQMAGLLLGGIFWGVLGDKKGRLSVLFGSIFIYSIANILNAFVTSIEVYGTLRFIAGVGLAGELGAGITLVCELMDKKHRGFGTALVASIGVLGAVVAALVGDFFTWKVAYIIGGVMGLGLLVLRIGVSESGMFEDMKTKNVRAGDFFALFGHWNRFKKYLAVIFVGVPIWFVIGILMTFSPEFGKAFQMSVLPTAGKAVMFCYIGLALGDMASGLLSQWLQSRKKVFAIFLGLLAFTAMVYFWRGGHSLFIYYALCLFLGFAIGYWAIFVTVASEQFGTNIRSTVTTTAPNFVRGSLIPLTIAFQYLKSDLGIQKAAMTIGSLTLLFAFVALTFLDETFHKDLSYLES